MASTATRGQGLRPLRYREGNRIRKNPSAAFPGSPPLRMASRAATAFARTPKEVFAIVFELVVGCYSLNDLHSICLVCRSWYNLATGLPYLWTFLPIYPHTSHDKLQLWLRRSLCRPLRILLPAPDVDSLEDHWKQPYLVELLPTAPRWGIMVVDCLWRDEAALWWTVHLDGASFDVLEELTLKLSATVASFPTTCAFPRIRHLTLGRTACKWSETHLEMMSKTLTSFTLSNVSPEHDLALTQLLGALRCAPGLQILRIDEVEWAVESDPTKIQCPAADVNLPNLKSLTLTTVSEAYTCVRPLKIPKLTELILGEVYSDLGAVFSAIAQKTSSIRSLTTGIWDGTFDSQSEKALVALLEKQPHLRDLVVQDATITDQLIIGLTPPPPRAGRIGKSGPCPSLERLELPGDDLAEDAVLVMATLRYRKRIPLGSLTISGGRRWRHCSNELKKYVREFVLEEEEGEEREL